MTDSTHHHDPQHSPAIPGTRCSAIWIAAVYGLFFLSGTTSLIYEVLWVRKFGLVFGVTTYAVSTVLAAFFAGLAVGSFFAGRIIDRTSAHPLRVYGALEAVIGLYALMLPHFLNWVETLYPMVYEGLSESFGLFTLFRFTVCFGLLAVPTTLMGATLPVLSKLLVSREARLGVNVGRLYAANTFGAVAGTAGAGFFLLPTFGVPETTWITACGNFALAAGAVLLSRARAFRIAAEQTIPLQSDKSDLSDKSNLSAPSDKSEASDSTGRSLALFLACISGLTILALEVVWTRSLILILGSTTYAFSIMLTAVLVGIAVGSAVCAHLADRVRHRAVWAGALLFLGGACAVFGPAVMNRLPFVFLRLSDWAAGRWPLILTAQFVVCFLLVFIPTFFSGGSFPLLVRLHSQGESRVGRTVADVYAMNTIGGIVGSLLGGFVLVRYVGLQPALTIAALTLMALGGVSAVALAGGRGRIARTGLAAAMLALVVVLGVFHPRFDTKLLFGGWGPFAGGYHTGHTAGSTVDVTDRHMSRLLYHKEGVSASVDAIETAWGDRILSINAQPVATTYLWDLRLLKMIGHLPVLLHDNPRDALVIGMGAGVAAGVMAGYGSLSEVTVVELSEEVPGGAAQFADWNFDVLNNPKLRIVINDGANYVKAVRKQFDLIGSDPIHPFLLGNGTLYSVEHWRACRDRLRDGGVLVQWLPMYQLSADDFATVIRTFAEAFPNATVWYSGIDVILIGIKGERRIDLERMADHMRDAAMRADLASLGAAEPPDVLGWLVGGPQQIETMAVRGAVNRLDYPVLEFSAPKAILLRGVSATIPLLIETVNRTSDTEFCRLIETLVKGPQPRAMLDAAVAARRAQYWVMRGVRASHDSARQYLFCAEMAHSLRPEDAFLRQTLADAQVSLAGRLWSDCWVEDAYRLYCAAFVNDPTRADAITGAVWTAWENGDVNAADALMSLASARHGHTFQVQVLKGLLAFERKDWPNARRAFQKARVHGQQSPLLLTGLGILSLAENRHDSAYSYFDKALAISTRSVYTLRDITELCRKHGFDETARRYAPQLVAAADAAISESPESPAFYYMRALGKRVLGNAEDAEADEMTAAFLRELW